jgi:hypothetical protein
MGPAFFVVAILGCADGAGASCTPVATIPTRYESRAACLAATATELGQAGDFDFPTIVAECREAKMPAAGRSPAQRITVPARQG